MKKKSATSGYRHKITLQYISGTVLTNGIDVPNHVNGAEVYAAIEPLSGKELFNAQAINSELTTKIRFRYMVGVTSLMRIKYGTRTFEIQSPPIDKEEQHKELILLCKEVL